MWRDPWRDAPPNGYVPEPRISETELRLIGWGLATTGVAGLLVWLSGQLAGLLFGHTWLHLSVGDVAAILWRLPGTMSDPKLAWPADVRGALPGPVGMYLSAVLVVGTIAGVVAGVVRLAAQYLPGRAPGHRPGREHTRRHRKGSVWASGRELRLLYVRRPPAGPGHRGAHQPPGRPGQGWAAARLRGLPFAADLRPHRQLQDQRRAGARHPRLARPPARHVGQARRAARHDGHSCPQG